MNRGGLVQPSIDQQFFSSQNETQIVAALANEVQRSGLGSIGQDSQSRLVKTVKHYMSEVWDVNGPMPIPNLNREVLNIASQDFAGYLRRQAMGGRSLGASQKIVSTEQPARAEVAQQRLQIQQGVLVQPRPTFENTLLMDTGSRFEQMQQDRNGGGAARPPPPKFELQLSSNAEEPSALAMFEAAKKIRESEAAKQVPIGGEGDAVTDANPLVRFMSPPSLLNDANANPTTSLPILTPAPRGPLPQDFLIKQDDIINYREIEYNLVLYSADRDWLNNSTQSRYVFSVNFDPGNNRQGFYSQLTTNKKFKNISRIELVKAIIPTEGLITLTQRVDTGGGGVVYTNDAKLNALTYPYIALRIPELDVNNYGSDDILNNSFATLQYDANWYSDTTNLEDGYLAMIPKFMKCQKIYQPTPLATLQKLTIEMLTPEGEPLSKIPDTIAIQNIYLGSDGTYQAVFPDVQIPNYYNSVDGNNMGDYILLQTTTYFSKWQFAEGNRIAIQGLNLNQVPGGSSQAAQNLLDYLQNPQGLPILAIGYTANTPVLGTNAAGYANVIIVRAPHIDPTTGSVDVQPFGGSIATMTDLANSINGTSPGVVTYTGAKMINLSHQTNVVLRVICREMDPAARVRPDNL